MLGEVGADFGEEEEEGEEETTMGLILGLLLHIAAIQIVRVHRSQGGDRAFGLVLRLVAWLATRWVGEAIGIALYGETDRRLLGYGMTTRLGENAAHGRAPLLGFRLPLKVRDSAQQDEDNECLEARTSELICSPLTPITVVTRRRMPEPACFSKSSYDITSSREARSNADKSHPGRQQKRHQAVIPFQSRAT